MAGTKTIYNASAADFLCELLYRQEAVEVDRERVAVSIHNDSGTSGRIRLVPIAAPYVETIEIPYAKFNISPAMPTDMCYGNEYPVTFDRFATYFASSYDLAMRPGEWSVEHAGQTRVLNADTLVDIQVDNSRVFKIRATEQHPLFVAGSGFDLMITTQAFTINPLVVTVAAPNVATVGDAYNYPFVASGGEGPYRFELISGRGPVAVNAAKTGFVGNIAAEGQFDYVLEVTDSRNRKATVEMSTFVILAPFTITGKAPDALVGSVYRHEYQLAGGLTPYTLLSVTGLPQTLRLSTAGVLTGNPDVGDYPITLRFRDALGTIVEHTDTVRITGRELNEFGPLLWNKFWSWVSFDAAESQAPAPVQVYHDPDADWLYEGAGLSGVRGPRVGALRFQTGYVYDRTTDFEATRFAVVMWVRRAISPPNGCLISHRSDASGWDVSTGDAGDGSLRVRAHIGDDVYYCAADDVVLTDWQMVTVQVGDGLMSIYRNTTLVHQETVPVGPIHLDGLEQLVIGGRFDQLGSYQWRGDNASTLILTAPLKLDEINYLYNDGVGRSYRDVQQQLGGLTPLVPVNIVLNPMAPRVGEYFTATVEVTGGQVIRTLRVLEGSLPPGLALVNTGPREWAIRGVPEAVGTHQFALYVGSRHDAARAPVTLTVSA